MCLKFVIVCERLNADPKICFINFKLTEKNYNSKHTLKNQDNGVKG